MDNCPRRPAFLFKPLLGAIAAYVSMGARAITQLPWADFPLEGHLLFNLPPYALCPGSSKFANPACQARAENVHVYGPAWALAPPWDTQWGPKRHRGPYKDPYRDPTRPL